MDFFVCLLAFPRKKRAELSDFLLLASLVRASVMMIGGEIYAVRTFYDFIE